MASIAVLAYLWHSSTSSCFSRCPSRTHRGVALQVAFERQILKPVIHLIGFRLWV
jgi:hypothetical protein